MTCANKFTETFKSMHILQPKQTKLKLKEVEELLVKFNISISQLPKIRADDPSIPEGCQRGDIIKLERKSEEVPTDYYRVVA
jgi:DNA-directed RNA polymerase subunit H (RpoH/RPB5)